MATPESNLQLANLLFAPLREGAGRYMDAQVQIAARDAQERKQREMMNLRRMQEIQDQQATAELNMNLANLRAKTEKDIAADRLATEGARIKASEDRMNTQLTADEKKRLRENMHQAFAAYKGIGGTKKIEEFGPLDDINTLFAIDSAVGEKKNELLMGEAQMSAKLLAQRNQALEEMTKLGDEEKVGIAIEAVGSLGKEHDDAKDIFLGTLASKGGTIETALQNVATAEPGSLPYLKNALNRGFEGARALKISSPEYVKAAQDTISLRDNALKRVGESPQASTYLLQNLLNPESIKKTAPPPPKLPPPPPKGDGADGENALKNLTKTYSNAGLLGVADSARGGASPVDVLRMVSSPVQSVAREAMTTPASWLTRNLPYMAGVPLQIAGGDALVRASGIDQYDTLLNNLRSQNFQQLKDAVRPSYQKTADMFRNLLPVNP